MHSESFEIALSLNIYWLLLTVFDVHLVFSYLIIIIIPVALNETVAIDVVW